jgi:deoxyribonuclease-2
LAIEGNQGFWLIHSVPRFPVSIADYNSNGYSFPDEETKYAQSFLCLTLDTATFETVAQAMLIDWPQIYDSTISATLTKKLPSLASLLQGQKTKGATAQYFNITTSAGKNFVVFAKNREWDNFLYSDLVAPTLNDGLFVESWQNGVGKIGSVCRPYRVFDVQNVSLPDGHWWKVTQDHSKWAITMSAHWSCVGDINREDGQTKRGGGTVCTLDDDLWTAFQQTIADVNKTCGHHRL